MYQTIVDAMKALGETRAIFGAENPQRGESQFQSALGDMLDRMTKREDWAWRHSGHKDKEERFKTGLLSNEDTIAIDLVGRHPQQGIVAIELKYVLAPPKDKYAFPWDVAKDCLKLDLFKGGLCTPVPHPTRPVRTYVLAMTDWQEYWCGTGSFGWATDFVNAMRTTPVRFEGVLQTRGRNSENAIYRQKRCHIAFGRSWTGEWHQYGATGRFRFLLLRADTNAQPNWTHHQSRSIEQQSEIIPFLDSGAREEWRRRHFG